MYSSDMSTDDYFACTISSTVIFQRIYIYLREKHGEKAPPKKQNFEL